MKPLDIAFSPCPNDTFIFHALLYGLIDTGDYTFKSHIHDVEYLNRQAEHGAFTITKLSFNTYLRLRDTYALLPAGSALGFGCGPILIKGNSTKPLESMTIAIPGAHTTAYLLLQLWNNNLASITETTFDRIITGISSGQYDAGLIIHEGRFIYQDYGLRAVIDLGQWWEEQTGLPIPLGCIAIRRDADQETVAAISRILRDSVIHALRNRNASRDFVKSHAQEMDDSVIDEHINLYVNDFTIDLGEKGLSAIKKLEDMALRRNLI